MSYIECDVPEEMTLREWRHSRATGISDGRRHARRLRRAIAWIRASDVETA